MIEDIRAVGPLKPLSYMRLPRIFWPVWLISHKWHDYHGLRVRLFKPAECRLAGGALYVYDVEALTRLLAAHRPILAEFEWPQDPDKFVEKVAAEVAQPGTSLHLLIADAFADWNNPWREYKPH